MPAEAIAAEVIAAAMATAIPHPTHPSQSDRIHALSIAHLDYSCPEHQRLDLSAHVSMGRPCLIF